MVYREYNYRGDKEKVKTLMRKRLSFKDKIRYHKLKLQEIEDKLLDIEEQIEEYLN